MAESYSRTLVATTVAMLLIPQSVGVLAKHRTRSDVNPDPPTPENGPT